MKIFFCPATCAWSFWSPMVTVRVLVNVLAGWPLSLIIIGMRNSFWRSRSNVLRAVSVAVPFRLSCR